MEIRRADDVVTVVGSLKNRSDALYVITDPLVSTYRIRINTLALGARLPTIYGFRELAESGGLMSYGPYFPALYRRTAEFVDKILRGTKPADIPVEQPTKFELIINLTTAKALGLEVAANAARTRRRGDRVMKRRELMTLAGLAAAWPLAVRAQQAVTPVIGFLNIASPGPLLDTILAAFQRGLSELGFIEGRNIAIEYRWADGHYERLPELAADLVRRHVDVIAAVGSSSPGSAAKTATSTIPIVFQTGGDPVVDGLVASMNRPGGNVTGVSRMTVALDPKRLGFCTKQYPEPMLLRFW